MGEDACEPMAWALTPRGIPLELLSAASLRPAPMGHPGLPETLCEGRAPWKAKCK